MFLKNSDDRTNKERASKLDSRHQFKVPKLEHVPAGAIPNAFQFNLTVPTAILLDEGMEVFVETGTNAVEETAREKAIEFMALHGDRE